MTCCFAIRFGIEIVPIAMTSGVFECGALIAAMIVIVSRDVIPTTSRNWWQTAWVLYITAVLFALFDRAEVVLIAATAAISEQFAKAFLTIVEVTTFECSTIARLGWQVTVLRLEWS